VIGVLVSGRGTNLQALLEAELPVAAVASSRADAPALARARARDIPAAVFDTPGADGELAEWLTGHGVELVVLAGYMRILGTEFLERFPGAVLNVHPSLLPAFPGAHAVEDALAYGVRWTGVTVHLVDEGVDTGPIVCQEPVAVRDDDTPESLHARLQEVEHRLLPHAVRLFLDGRLRLPPGSRRVMLS
jgi:phosphoribosylglycinamide formyltransferase 1